MGNPTPSEPALRILAAFSRYPEALAWARQTAVAAWGPVALESQVFAFDQTDYYQATMGPALGKCFWAFETLYDPAEMVDTKLQTNDWEQQYAGLAGHEQPRPLNLDPGYLTNAKLILASTKDYAHRIYLSRGIYAEVTLQYQERAWRDHRWTFPDYKRADYQEFFTEARNYLRARQKQERR